jgi:putative DNA primase/helicase
LERPEDRVFQSNPVQTVIANRGKYVAAALTIARAYVVAGYPDRLNPLPSFERWSDIVRSALVWLKMPDPCRSMELARAEDPIRAARAALFLSWEREIGINPHGMTTGDMVASANASAPTQDGYELLHPQFREACIAVASERDGKTISTRRLGKYLAAAEKNKIGDLKLTADRSDPTRVRWVLSQSAP